MLLHKSFPEIANLLVAGIRFASAFRIIVLPDPEAPRTDSKPPRQIEHQEESSVPEPPLQVKFKGSWLCRGACGVLE